MKFQCVQDFVFLPIITISYNLFEFEKKEFKAGHSYNNFQNTRQTTFCHCVVCGIFFLSEIGVLITYINQLSDCQVLA